MSRDPLTVPFKQSVKKLLEQSPSSKSLSELWVHILEEESTLCRRFEARQIYKDILSMYKCIHDGKVLMIAVYLHTHRGMRGGIYPHVLYTWEDTTFSRLSWLTIFPTIFCTHRSSAGNASSTSLPCTIIVIHPHHADSPPTLLTRVYFSLAE